MTKGWTEERRRKQAETICRAKPWEKSTGPRTAKGKEASCRNAWKHGERSEARRVLEEGLRLNRAFLQQIAAYCAAEQLTAEILAGKRTNEKTEQ